MHVSAASTAVHTGMMGCRGDRSEGEVISDTATYLKGTGNSRTR